MRPTPAAVRFRILFAFATVVLALGACSLPSSGPAIPRATDAGAVKADPVAIIPTVASARPTEPTRPAGPGARNVFVMLSGGASPMSNNYSQYLQAKGFARFFEQNYPADAIWTFFGAGNVEGDQAFFGDVRRQVKKDGLVLETWLPGPVTRNRPAKREIILRTLREEILPAVRDGGTLYLVVGDHGSLSRNKQGDAQIDLWGVDPDPASERKWKLVNNEKLTVSDLREALNAGLGQGRVVFCMTQCYSGGFQFLGIPREVSPNPKWFTRVPAWVALKPEEKLPLAAGYTATDHYSLAAGCDPDPDPDRWAGYERFVPENLLGLDLFTLEPAGKRRDSFFAAHIEATLVDKTIDKPHATSERYLERWATLIETKLAKDPSLTPELKRAVDAFQRAVNTGVVQAIDPALRERQALFAHFTQRLTEQNAEAKNLLLKGTREELEKVIGQLPAAARFVVPTAAPHTHGTGATAEALKLWKETIRPAWKAAVAGGQIKQLANPHALQFEKSLQAEEDKGRDMLFVQGRGSPVTALIFWASGATDPATADPAKAEAIARWGASRRRTITEWARASHNAEVKAAAAKAFAPVRRPTTNAPTSAAAATPTATRPSPAAPTKAPVRTSNVSTRPLSRKTAAERVLFYRRTLAAWEFLLTLNERPALERIRELTDLERTPLPPPEKTPVASGPKA